MSRRVLCAVLIGLLAAGPLAGCWSRKEIQELTIVIVMGVDWDAERQRYDVTMQIARPAFQARPGEPPAGGGPASRPFFFFQASGQTVAEALTKTTTMQTRRLYLGYMQAVIHGQAAARRGIGPTLSLLWRNHEMRPIVEMLVTRGTARDLLTGDPGLAELPGRGLVVQLEWARQHSLAPRTPLGELMPAITHQGNQAAMIPIISVRPSGTPSPSTAQAFAQFRIEGVAVFDQDRLAAFLTAEESRGVMWARGEVTATVITVPGAGPGGEAGSFVVRGHQARLRLQPRPGGALPAATVQITAGDDLVQRNRLPEPLSAAEVRRLQGLAAETITGEVQAALAATKAAGADAIGFGELLRRTDPKRWHQVREGWDELYRELPVTVQAEVRLERTGLAR